VAPSSSRTRWRSSGASRAPPFWITSSDAMSCRFGTGEFSQFATSGTAAAMTVTRSRSTIGNTVSASGAGARTTFPPQASAPMNPGEARL
jgi:hypothetical protein